MFSLTISDHFMIAHSLRGDIFGPAQQLHGNTLVVDVEFRARALDQFNTLLDLAAAKTELRRVLGGFDFKNLDEHPDMAGQNTTIEFLARHIHGLLADACRQGRLGAGGRALSSLKVQLRESPVARAGFDAPIE